MLSSSTDGVVGSGRDAESIDTPPQNNLASCKGSGLASAPSELEDDLQVVGVARILPNSTLHDGTLGRLVRLEVVLLLVSNDLDSESEDEEDQTDDVLRRTEGSARGESQGAPQLTPAVPKR